MDQPDPSADEIRREMRRIRCHMIHEVDELVDGARELTSLRYYVRKHPWSIFSGLVALGFTLVPRRTPTAKLDVESLRELAKGELFANAAKASPSKGLVGSLVGLASSYALRTGLNLASQHLGRWFQSRGTPETGQPPQNQGPQNREATRS
jgi:hypothetical protein